MSVKRPRFAVWPEGTTAAPSFGGYPLGDFPAPQEHVDLLTKIDWPWVRAKIDAGDAVAFVVDVLDTGALLDAMENRLGSDVVVRLTDNKDMVVWVARLPDRRSEDVS